MKSIRLFVLCALFSVGASFLYAQKDTVTFVPKRTIPKATLKVSPAAFVNVFRASLFVSSDIYLTRHVVLDVGAGWFFGSVLQQHTGETYNGYRQRLGFKYVFLSDRKVAPYIGVEAKFNYIREKRIENVLRFGGQYSELMLLNRTTLNYGANLRGGIHVIPDRKRRFILDIYAGFGFKQTNIKMPIPEDAEFFIPKDFGLERNPGVYNLPDALFGFNLGYCFH